MRFLTILTGRNVPKIRQPREPEPSTINEKTIADFTRVVEQTEIYFGGRSSPFSQPITVSVFSGSGRSHSEQLNLRGPSPP